MVTKKRPRKTVSVFHYALDLPSLTVEVTSYEDASKGIELTFHAYRSRTLIMLDTVSACFLADAVARAVAACEQVH